jgi:hypothetical protein
MNQVEARVPRYFFNVRGDGAEIDTEGIDLTSHDAARLAAVQLTGEILIDEAHRLKFGDTWHLEVLDEAGGNVCDVGVRISALPTRD